MKLAPLALSLLLAGCSAPTIPVAANTSPAPSVSVTSPAAPPDEEEPREPTDLDFEARLKVVKKQCFGSAGCNVSFKVNLVYVGFGEVSDLPDNIDITFVVKGGEEPYVSTIEMEDGQYSPDEATIGTRSSKSKLTVKITDVESY